MSDAPALSLQSLYEMLQTKADKTHTHVFAGSIESALSLRGVPYSSFVRNDVSSQSISVKNETTSFGINSETTNVRLEAGRHKASLVIGDESMTTTNLTITGQKATNVVVNVVGDLMVNQHRVLTVNEVGDIAGIDLDELDIAGRGILVSAMEPNDPSDGMIWAQVLEDDLIEETSPKAINKAYTVPVGTIVESLTATVPNGYLLADGREVSRSIYPALWNFARTRTRLLTEADWLIAKDARNIVEAYSPGNGNMTFRLPLLYTGGNTVKLIKAYDELGTSEMINLQEFMTKVATMETSKVVTGVGFMKFGDGTLIQHGRSFKGTCLFSIPFINDEYTLTATYEGTLTGINVTIDPSTRMTTRCGLRVIKPDGNNVLNAECNYVAVGRWM